MKNLTLRQWGVFFFVVSALVLASVFISQYGFGLQPCKLCLWERWPYAATGLLGLILTVQKNNNIGSFLLFLLAVIFLGSGALALFHVGVEQHWWTFNSDCVGSVFKSGASAEQVLAALQKAPIVRCDQKVEFLFGFSMAFYNMLTSLGLSGIAMVALYKSRSISLSQ